MKCLALLSLLVCFEASAQSFLPENNLYIGVSEKTKSSVTEEEFNKVLDAVYKVYAPIMTSMGKTLIIDRKWADGTVNAYASQAGNKWTIAMFGGLARHNLMTVDAFTLVACHELGHHLGGMPKKALFSWPSAEGQADYFSAAKCIKRLYHSYGSERRLIGADPTAVKLCGEVYLSEDETDLCVKTAMAGLTLGNLFLSLGRGPGAVSLATPDLTEVSKTNVRGYPGPQCRTDTYFQGALCDVPYDQDVSNTDILAGLCSKDIGTGTYGSRPRCWFNPSDFQ